MLQYLLEDHKDKNITFSDEHLNKDAIEALQGFSILSEKIRATPLIII